MKINTFFIGVVLVILGFIALTYDRIPYRTERERVGWGPFQATVEKEKSVPVSNVIGIIVLVAGVILIIKNRRKK